jgi:hypothetical protein
VAAGYFWSILFMLSMPFLLVSAYGLSFYYMCRTAARRQAQQDRQSAPKRVDGLAQPSAG